MAIRRLRHVFKPTRLPAKSGTELGTTGVPGGRI
jgi:hypothetical protein